jgi:hypothetical protein
MSPNQENLVNIRVKASSMVLASSKRPKSSFADSYGQKVMNRNLNFYAANLSTVRWSPPKAFKKGVHP